MSTDALFGPDGTQPPDPLPPLPDPLVGGGAWDSAVLSAQPPVKPSVQPSVRPPVQPSSASDATGLRDAAWSAFAGQPTERRFQRPPPPRPKPPPPPLPLPPPPPPRPKPPADAVRTPPSGIPVQSFPEPAPASSRPASSSLAQPLAPLPAPSPTVQQRGSGWIGCIVVLIFFVIVVVNIVSGIVDAIFGS
ncbi:MAG TPA: hypothetical protein VFM37_15350 [Pseudonocardiaceae bacterium]|nr:hypothetical protein [Pseudonocardiaceae bacterium]